MLPFVFVPRLGRSQKVQPGRQIFFVRPRYRWFKSLPADKGAWARFRGWLGHLHFRLVTIEDTPHSIALGVAIGIFFGFTPLWSLKTLLSIARGVVVQEQQNRGCDQRPTARSDPALHARDLPLGIQIWLLDDAWPFAAADQFPELSVPGQLLAMGDAVFPVGRPLLIGSLIVGLPSATIVYFICRGLVTTQRTSRKEQSSRPKFSRRTARELHHQTGVVGCRPRRRRLATYQANYEISSSPSPPACSSAPAPTWTSPRAMSRTPRGPPESDAKDFGSQESVVMQANCGVGAAHPPAIYIRPFCIDCRIFTGDETASDGEMPIRKALTPVAFADDLKEQLRKSRPPACFAG